MSQWRALRLCGCEVRGRCRSGEADEKGEVSEPDMEYPASGPVHDERQQDDGQDDDDDPEEEHDDAGDGMPGYGSGSSHGRQLPAAARLIRYRGVNSTPTADLRPLH